MFGTGNEFIVCTVVAPVPAYAARFLNNETLRSYYAEQAEMVLSPIRKFTEQKAWEASLIHLQGHAAEAVATLASESRPDLIVMGSHGHSALGNVVMGSVANGVLARCNTPVLLVR